MSNLLRQRAELFGKYVSAEVKGAIVARGYTQTDVAKAIHRQGANLSRWLNGKPTIPIEVALEICDYIGASLQQIVTSANTRVENELGPWPPIEVNPDMLSDDDRRRIVLEKLSNGGMGLAAYEDENKEAERDADPDDGA
jgi:transcriptional regulator with XRE-family HTH domain